VKLSNKSETIGQES